MKTFMKDFYDNFFLLKNNHTKKTQMFVCHCGFAENNHEFKHSYQDFVRVEKIEKVLNNDEKNTVKIYGGYRINADDFPVKKGQSNCIVPQCGRNKIMHTSGIIQHEFKFEEYEYREIIFSIPEDTVCNSCTYTYGNHEKIKHPFSANIHILNKAEKDVIKVLDNIGIPITSFSVRIIDDSKPTENS